MSSTSQAQTTLQSIYIAQGFGTYSNEACVTFGGNYGVSQWLSGFAEVIGNVVDANDIEYADADDAYDDVCEYQVTSGMGGWLSQNFNATPASFCVELKSSCEKFFAKPCSYLDPVMDAWMARFEVDPREWHSTPNNSP